MAMSSAQQTAFQTAVGYTPSATATTVAGIIAVAFLLWASWIVLFRMKQWQKGTSDLNDLVWGAVRVAGLLLLVFWFVR